MVHLYQHPFRRELDIWHPKASPSPRTVWRGKLTVHLGSREGNGRAGQPASAPSSRMRESLGPHPRNRNAQLPGRPQRQKRAGLCFSLQAPAGVRKHRCAGDQAQQTELRLRSLEASTVVAGKPSKGAQGRTENLIGALWSALRRWTGPEVGNWNCEETVGEGLLHRYQFCRLLSGAWNAVGNQATEP